MRFVTIEDRGAVRWLTMDNPGRRNAVPESGWDELASALEAFDADPDARVLVLIGAGGDFCAGADLETSSFDVSSAAVNAERMSHPNRAATALHRVGKPTIALVRGVAAGAGMNLAIGCDVVIAADDARFSEIFVRRGLTLDFGGAWLLPRLVGLARAREIALTGRIVESEEARSIGLVAAVVPSDALEEAGTELASSLAAGAPMAQRFIKQALDRSSAMTFEQALAFEAQAQAILLGSDDVREGVLAFLEKRDPRFMGR